jgi:putative membrane protein
MANTVTAFNPSAVWMTIPLAHGGPLVTRESLWTSWNFDPVLLFGLMVPAWAYGAGLRRVWRQAGRGRGTAEWQAAAFSLGLLTLTVALVSPLDALSGALVSAHMIQHMLLMMVAAPLIALGAPTYTFAWALSPASNRALARWWRQRSILRGGWYLVTRPLTIGLFYTSMLTLWHVPWLYEAAAHHDAVHTVEHALFFGAALLFWWSVVHAGRPGGIGQGIAILMLFVSMLFAIVLSALMTFSAVPWYPHYTSSAIAWGLSPLEDQQLAGAIMWVPSKAVHLLAALALLWLWFDGVGRRTRRREMAARHPAIEPAPEDRVPLPGG